MKSSYGNPWTRNPYANPKVEAARANAEKRRRALMINVAVWSGVPATVMMVAVALALR